MKKHIDNGESLNKKILNGANILADIVASTLGPRGRNVILKQKKMKPVITKDGVTCAQFISLQDPFENAAAQIILQAAEETNQIAGDGTSTSTILARAILQKAQAALAAGACPVEMKRGIEKSVDNIIEALEDFAKPIKSMTDIEKIATISANGDKGIGKLIAMAVDKVGKDGSVSLQEAHSNKTSLEVYEGFRFDSGLFANALVTDERRGTMRYEKCIVLVTDHKIDSIDELLPILEQAARDGRPFIIVAEQVEGQALGAIIYNKMKGDMKVSAIKAPRYGEERREILEDLAMTIGAKFISRLSGIKLSEVQISDLGEAQIVESNNQTTTIVASSDLEAESLVEEKIEVLKERLKHLDVGPEAEKLQERITRLVSGVAVIKVGAPTQIDMIEKKHRIEDALEAVNAAQLEGMLVGGGVTLIRSAEIASQIETLPGDQQKGADIVFEACKEPFRIMCENAGLSPDVYIQKLYESLEFADDDVYSSTGCNNGIDISTGEEVDMMDAGIIDPLKVTKNALKNAASAASTLITTNFAVIDSDD